MTSEESEENRVVKRKKVLYKIHWNGDVRRLRISGYKQLLKTITRWVGKAKSLPKLYWYDDFDEWILFMSEEEWEDAVIISEKSKLPLRIRVGCMPVPLPRPRRMSGFNLGYSTPTSDPFLQTPTSLPVALTIPRSSNNPSPHSIDQFFFGLQDVIMQEYDTNESNPSMKREDIERAILKKKSEFQNLMFGQSNVLQDEVSVSSPGTPIGSPKREKGNYFKRNSRYKSKTFGGRSKKKDKRDFWKHKKLHAQTRKKSPLSRMREESFFADN